MRSITVIVLFIGVCTISCSKKSSHLIVSEIPEDATDYLIEKRKARMDGLTAPEGWLSVIGLHWLDEGINTIGAADDNSIVFPRIETETIGAYQKTGDDIFFGKVEGVEVLSNGHEYMGGPVEVGYPPTVANHQSLYWYVIKRGDKYGIRLKDTLADNRLHFTGIPYYEDDLNYKVMAKVTVPQKEEKVDVTNVLGKTTAHQVAAYLDFELGGKAHRLSAFDEGGEVYFVVFGDLTNGDGSYGGGRFLYPQKAEDGTSEIVLDFNLAENPPCAFTDFATCPLPPESNILDLEVRAGEKAMPGH